MRAQNLLFAFVFVAIAALLLRTEADRRTTEFIHQQKTDMNFEDSKEILKEVQILRIQMLDFRREMDRLENDAWERGWEEAVNEYNLEMDPPYYSEDGC